MKARVSLNDVLEAKIRTMSSTGRYKKGERDIAGL